MEQMKVFYNGEQVILVWDGLSAHWSRAMRAWVAEQDWLTLERAYAPELNPVELLWSSLKKRELANLAGDHLADVADATEQGIRRINTNPQLPGPSSPTPASPSTHQPHRTNEKIK
ncbi:transposase [Streptomyces sp. NPDC013457]|uniref:transposase n=1 Tax=Streptomyces sp. NPDC013457 TaxID=3364866 RepID=UPI0036F94F3E